MRRHLRFFMVPMDQPGVTVRPIRKIGGSPDFNEVFLDRAGTAIGNVVGEVDNGWEVANSLLSLERGDEATTNLVLFRAEFDRMVEMARDRGGLADPVILVLGPEASISKVQWSEYHRDITRLAIDIIGADAMVLEGRAPLRGYRYDDPGAPKSIASWVGALYN